MTPAAIKLRFTVKVIGDPVIVLEPEDIDRCDLRALRRLMEDELRLEIVPDPDDLAELEIAWDLDAADREHAPDRELARLCGVEHLLKTAEG